MSDLWLRMIPRIPSVVKVLSHILDVSEDKIIYEVLKGKHKDLFLPSFEGDEKYIELSSRGILFVKYNEIEMLSKPLESDPTVFFDLDKFVPKLLGDDILKRLKLRTTTDNETIFVYSDGIWHNDGENDVKCDANIQLQQKVSNHRIKEVVEYIKRSTYINRKEFDPNPYLIALENGVYDVQNKKFMKHDPSFMLTVKLPVKYEPDAKCPKFLKFVSQIVDESDIPVIQELTGWALRRDYNIQKMVMLVGEGANGKSTFLNTIKMLLGNENVANMSPQELVNDRFAKSRLYGKLANIYNDVPDKALRETGILKMLTGGDAMDVQEKFKGFFSYTNYAKMLFSANKVPIAKDDTDAWFRRWVFLNFPNKFEGKKAQPQGEILDTFEAELPGIFLWAVEGLIRLDKNRKFTNSKSTEDIREQYVRMSDPIAAFCMDSLEEDNEGFVVKDYLYAEYVQYCKKHKLILTSKDQLGKKIIQYVRAEAGKKRIDGSLKPIWKGIVFKNKEDATQKQGKLTGF